jgi:hypothetical protein
MRAKEMPLQAIAAAAALPIQIAPLDLAQLTARLVEAGLIQGDAGHKRTIARAMEFLRLCNEVQMEQNKFRELRLSAKEHLASVARFIRKSETGGYVPVAEILKRACVDALNLNTEELRSLGIAKSWTELKAEQQAHAIYELLARKSVKYDAFVPDGDASLRRVEGITAIGGALEIKHALKNGVSVSLVPLALDYMERAKEELISERNSVSGKKRKPRLRADDGQFAARERNSKGQFSKPDHA